jgi:hypothetical protein
MTDRLFAWMDRLTLACALAGMAVLAVAMAVVLADIVMRSTVGIAVLGTVDITQLCVMACAFWAIPYAFIRAGHVRVEVGAERMPNRLRHGLERRPLVRHGWPAGHWQEPDDRERDRGADHAREDRVIRQREGRRARRRP